MKQSTLIRQLKEAAPEFEKLSWLEEVVLFGPALQEDPIDTDVDLLLITGSCYSGQHFRKTRSTQMWTCC